MGIWIRSQNRQVLVLANEIYVDNEYVFANYVDDIQTLLGEYSNETEAIHVLDKIQRHVGEVEYGRYHGNVIDPVFQMPEAGFSEKPEEFIPDCGMALNHCGLLDGTAHEATRCRDLDDCKAAWERGCR